MEFNTFAIHEHALRFRALRNQVLASNIANADTPNYKARDYDFGAALKSVSGKSISLTRTSDLHVKGGGSVHTGRLMYRVPMQATLDGNTVETDVEQAAFAENAVQYRVSLAFLGGQMRALSYALRGGD